MMIIPAHIYNTRVQARSRCLRSSTSYTPLMLADSLGAHDHPVLSWQYTKQFYYEVLRTPFSLFFLFFSFFSLISSMVAIYRRWSLSLCQRRCTVYQT